MKLLAWGCPTTPALGSGFEPDPAGPCPGAPHAPCPALSGVRPRVVSAARRLAQEGGASAPLTLAETCGAGAGTQSSLLCIH